MSQMRHISRRNPLGIVSKQKKVFFKYMSGKMGEKVTLVRKNKDFVQ